MFSILLVFYMFVFSENSFAMPGSNKKKFPLKPATKHPPSNFASQSSLSSSFWPSSSSMMVITAISSARKHGVHLRHGTPNAADGNCAF